MIPPSYDFDRPRGLEAREPPEERGVARDGVRLLVTVGPRTGHRSFTDLPKLLRPGDLLVVNESATVPASLPARGPPGPFLLNLSTHYGGGTWLAEPRWGVGRPGPLPIDPGTELDAAGVRVRAIGPFPGIDRLWFVHAEDDLAAAIRAHGSPIQYGYVARPYPLETYQTIFARVPGSSEMPSAARPFTGRVVAALAARGVRIARIVLHAGVSSLESEPDGGSVPPVYPEPFEVPAATAEAVERTRCEGGRVVAVGTTVLRALETAWDGERVRALRGFTRVVLGPERPLRSVDGLLTGLHDPRTSHLALLFGFAGEARVRTAYAEAVREGYLWHEFGDSHLVWARPAS
jgi:S-adenosylmethionine:tRNA ribosyltransferase-isomerase